MTPQWPESTKEPTTRLVGALTAVPGLVRELGVDPALVLADAGLPPGALDSPAGRIPYADFARLLAEAAARTRCPHFGLLAGAAWHLSHLGMRASSFATRRQWAWGWTSSSCFHHLNSGGGVAFLVKREGFADLGYAIHSPVAGSTTPIYDGVLAAAMNFVREIVGEEWCPSEVLLSHAAPADAAPYRRCFGTRVRFGAEFSALRFPATLLEQPNAGRRPGATAPGSRGRSRPPAGRRSSRCRRGRCARCSCTARAPATTSHRRSPSTGGR